VLVTLEAVGLVLLGVGYALAGLLADPSDRLGTVLAGASAVVLGLVLLPVARGLDRQRPWSRSPAVVVQLFALPVGIGLAQNRLWVPAAIVLGLAAGVLFVLATPEARLALRPER
jgi:heme A synthase